MPATPITPNLLTTASAPSTNLADPAGTSIDTTNGNSTANSGMTVLRVKNTDTASHTLTLLTPVTEDGLALADDPRVIPASSTVWIGRLPLAIYGAQLGMTSTSSLLQVTVFEP